MGLGSQDIYDPAFVKGVFDRCSSSYIALSFLFSFGFTERWRRQCVDAMPEPADGLVSGYDLMAGTGEVWPHVLRRFPGISSIIAVDISSGMHMLAMERLHSLRAHKIEFVEDNVLVSHLPAGSADFAISTFGLKTFDDQQQRDLARLVCPCCREEIRYQDQDQDQGQPSPHPTSHQQHKQHHHHCHCH
jgi:demethylmenaquinone methyltransferase/2-methoxy-6-polyprenyl-1,4-benzoquinol methylase